MNFSYSVEPQQDKKPLISALIDDFSRTSIDNGDLPSPTGRIE
jgi:hypothetical protein